ncbi:MAG TPA: hypothetical protein VFW25_15235 [Silvibacterium sp.]|nr:hypothetical protein [Silvibacterium sp.]
MMKGVRLCSHDLPSGRTCRQPVIKDEQVCRHHMRPYRHGMYEITHDEAMERLVADLSSMDAPRLLRTLQAKLKRIQSAVRADPEARIVLSAVLDRLRKIQSFQ